MEQFIVLGIVPGTGIQIDFDFMARILAIGAIMYLTALLLKEKRFVFEQLQDSINQKAI